MGDQDTTLDALKARLSYLRKYATSEQQAQIDRLEAEIKKREANQVQPSREVLELMGKANEKIGNIDGTIKSLEALKASIENLATFSVRTGQEKERALTRYN